MPNHEYLITLTYTIDSERPLSQRQQDKLLKLGLAALSQSDVAGDITGDVMYDENDGDYYGEASAAEGTITELGGVGA